MERGINFLNWCGSDDGIARAVREKLIARDRIVVATQLESRRGRAARDEMREFLRLLGTDRIEIVTFYYVEREEEWEEIIAPGGR